VQGDEIGPLQQLVELDRGMREGMPVVAHSTRHLIEARR